MTDQKHRLPTPWSGGMLDDFRREMDDLFSGFFGRGLRPTPLAALPQGVVAPAIDISENDKAVTLTAELPGLAEADVDLTVKDGRLILKGEKKAERDEERDDVHYAERAYGSFQRILPLPERVDAAQISAKFDKGVLTVTMPKKPGAAEATEHKVKIGA